jgi:hypothetical protein
MYDIGTGRGEIQEETVIVIMIRVREATINFYRDI